MEEEREKMRSAQLVAIERAQMAAKRYNPPLLFNSVALSFVKVPISVNSFPGALISTCRLL